MQAAHASAAEIARTCAHQAHFTKDREVARKPWRMALDYQRMAAALDSGTLRDIGPPPSWVK
jgi:hypothetical protein